MLVTLLWLTMSIPFVYKAQQQISIENVGLTHNHTSADDESPGNPLSNTTEEKCSNSFNSLSEEYLHHHFDEGVYNLCKNKGNYYHGHEDTYIAFHGELLCPPPNA